MANNLSRRPWVLDTADAVNPVKRGRTWTSGFIFSKYTNGQASKAILRDSRGLDICTLVGSADGSSVGEEWYNYQPVDDLVLAVIDSGIVVAIVK